jgi:hypothetical protein
MSLNFDVNSNLSLVRRFHTMKKLQKCVNFILTVPVFFATNCTWNKLNIKFMNSLLSHISFVQINSFNQINKLHTPFWNKFNHIHTLRVCYLNQKFSLKNEV